MIVWLASYPRSGNTLLRTVLFQTMGCESYNDEIDPEVRRSVGLKNSVEREFGHRELPGPWSDFYAAATKSSCVHYVKTHRSPPDSQPAVYVVRDGRRCLVSYLQFHRHFQQGRRSLLDLVMGHDYYGGWSEHYRDWTSRKDARTLVLRYEDLVDASESLLERLAGFLGPKDPPAPWINPFPRFNAENPEFFSQGRREWKGDAEWTSFIDAAFFRLHGDLMQALGYSTREELLSSRARLVEEAAALVDLAGSLARERRQLLRVCEERQEVISQLQGACEERLALIERLSAR